MRRNHRKSIRLFLCVVGVASVLAIDAMAQYGGSGSGTTSRATTGGGPTSVYDFHQNYHIGFDGPEAWGLKYFASTTLMSGLQPPEPSEGHRVGSVTVGFEMGWLPTLDDGQRRIGFKGTTPEDLNKSQIFV